MTTPPDTNTYLKPVINIPGFKWRKATSSDLVTLDELSKPAGYDIGIHNLRLYFNTSPSTWYLVETNDGEVVACTASNLLPTGDYFGLHPMIANGSKDAVLRFGPLYEVFGDKYCAYRATLNTSNLNTLRAARERGNYRIIPYIDTYCVKLITYDSTVIGFNREEFTKAYVEDVVNSRTLIALDATDQVVGYTVLRKFPTTWTIQPLYANSDDIAYDLYTRAACCLHEGDCIFSIFLAKSIVAMKFMRQLGAELCYTEQRWMMKECVECENRIDFDRVYSIHEFYPA